MRLFIALILLLMSWSTLALNSFVNELWVRDDFLRAPKGAALHGSYVQFTHLDDSLSLGILPVPFPVELPQVRGRVIFDPMPTYSHRGGISEWGKGFDKSLRIEHFAEYGEVRCSEDSYLSPWGVLVKSREANVYYLKGLEMDLRVVKTTEGFTSYHPDGSVYQFTQKYGELAYYLSQVTNREGHKTDFEYVLNSYARPLLSKVRYGGKRQAQYEVAIRYDRLKHPLKRYSPCGLETSIDRRVNEIEIKHWDGHAFVPVKLIRLSHDKMHLVKIETELSSKEKLPDIHYEYGKMDHVLGKKSYGRVDPQFQIVTDPLDDLFFFTKHLTWVDYNQDGVLDIERSTDLKAFLQTPAGRIEPYEDFYVASRQELCPPFGPYNHFLAPAERRRVLLRPSGIKDELYHLRLASDHGIHGAVTKIIACTLDGRVAYEKDIFFALESGLSFEHSTHLADLNGDLKPDLIKIGDEEYTFILNESTDGSIRFGEKVTRPLKGADNRRVMNYAVIDFNLDGIVDIVGQVRDGVMVWYGKGNQEFGEENFFTLTTPEGWVLNSPTLRVISWVDINRDGLVDLIASLYRKPVFFFQTGETLLEQRFNDLDNNLTLLDSYKVVNLSGGGNDQLATLEMKLGYIYFDLNEAATGLLTRIDNGQGVTVEIDYDFTKPQVGVPQLMVVVDKLSLSAFGKDTRTTRYQFADADINPENGHLNGFRNVRTMSADGQSAITFLTSSDFSPRMVSNTKSDARVDVLQIERREWLKAIVGGVPVLQLARIFQAYASKGQEILKRSTAYDDYERLCPQKIAEETPDGQLVRNIRYAKGPGCLKIKEKLQGKHPSFAQLDFEHGYEIERNEAQLPIQLKLLSESEPIVKTTLDYDENLNVKTVHQASTGTAVLAYDNLFEILKSLSDPDGTNSQITAFDFRADAMADFVTMHPDDQNVTQHFSYDGLGRLSEIANNWSKSQLSYRLASHTSPGLESDSLTHSTAVTAADGTPLTNARETAEGFVYAPLHHWLGEGTLEEEMDLSKTHENPRHLDFASLFLGKTVLSEKERSDLFGTLGSWSFVGQNQINYQTRQSEINPRELQATTTENGKYVKMDARSFATDEDGQTIHFERDMLDRLRVITLLSGDTQEMSVDAFGRTNRISRSNVGEISYSYDNKHDRLVKKTFLGEDEHFEYDDAGRVTKRNEFQFKYQGNRVVEVSHPDFTKRFEYEADGVVSKKSVQEHKKHFGIAFEFEYNAARDVVSQKVTGKSSYTKRYNYNQFRELTSIVVGQAVFDIDRNEAGKISKITLPTGHEFIIEYDPLTWHRTGYQIPGVARYRWQLDDRGLIERTEFVPANGHAQKFGYTYRPDKTLKSRYCLDNPFDSAGFTAAEIPKQYTPHERPHGVYDENRHLLAKYRDGNVSFLQFSGVSADASHVYEKLTIEGIDVGILVDGEFRLVLFDQVGSVLADADFVSIPNPFGRRQHSLLVGEHFDFAGHARDEETGLVRMGERDYDSQLQRFTSPDRFYLENPEECVRSPKECDLYSYARNNPLIYRDSDGKYVDTIIDIGFIAMSAYDLWKEPSWTNAAALGLDVVGAALPFATGLGKAFKAIDKAADAKSLASLDKAKDAVKEVYHANSGANNAAKGKKLAEQLTHDSARSPFTNLGGLTEDAIAGSTEIIKSGKLGNPAIPHGYSKYTTDTFRSASGDFQLHFYRNPSNGHIIYDLDYKAVFNRGIGK